MSSDLVLREALDQLFPASAEVADWEDVLQRARVRRAPRRLHRRAILALVLGIFVLLAGAALAVAVRLILGDPAPDQVKQQVRLSSRPPRGFIIPRPHRDSGVEAAKTFAAGVLSASTGPVYLWVAPTTRGGYCTFIQIVGLNLPNGQPNGGVNCDNSSRPISAAISATNVRGRMLTLAYGHTTKTAKSVELRLRDGTTNEVSVFRGFYITELPEGASVARATAVDVSGKVIASVRLHPRPRVTRPQGPWTTILRIKTRRTHRPITLAIGPGPHGTRCIQLTIAGGGRGSSCPVRLPKPREIAVYSTQIGGAPDGILILSGAVGSRIATLAVQFQDHSTEEIRIAHGFALYQLARKNYKAGHLPVALIGRDARGRILAKSPVR